MLNQNLAKWKRYHQEIVEWVDGGLEPFDAAKHKLGGLVNEREDGETFWFCNCNDLTAEQLEGKRVLVMPNCRHVHCEDCVVQHFKVEGNYLSPCLGKIVIKLQE